MTPLGERLLGPELAAWLEAGQGSRLALGRLPRPAWAVVAGLVAREAARSERTVLVLSPGPARLAAELRPWLAGRPPVHLFPEVTVSFLDRPPAFDQAVSQRLEALEAVARAPCVVVSSRRAMMRMTISAEELRSAALELRVGMRAEPRSLAGRLVELGYSREAMAESAGQFALRGGILDVYPAAAQAPVRAEFFGDELETLRLYDARNQRSVMAVAEASVRPGRELLLGPGRGRAAAARLRAGRALEDLRADVRADWEEELARLEVGDAFAGVELFGAYLEPTVPSLLDHLPGASLIIDLEPGRQLAEARELEQETLTLAAAESGDGELPRGFVAPMVPLERLLSGGPEPDWPRLSASVADVDGALDLGWREPEPVVGRPRAAAELADRATRETVILATEQGERLAALLGEPAASGGLSEVDLDLDLEAGPGLMRADTDLDAGWGNSRTGVWVYSDAELFGRVRRSPPPARRGSGRRETPVRLEFQPGELVVHVDHGVARFTGMRLLDAEDRERGGSTQREYLELEYADGDRLFVPVESLDRVQKYLGGGDQPALHRLGAGDWERARGRVRKNVQDVAEELLRIYSQREARPGYAFGPDGNWQAELEAAFPYEETPDQLQAQAEIKADMESERPMDRLLCGDVGFGKTELALRAAFKAVDGGRQVALLAPTTVLAQQHHMVFSQRLQGYPVTVEVLSRFRTEDEQKRTLAGLRAGAVDIVIGTHRLLQADVRFKRLGLLIVDEEQRFGVMQKERLKKLRTNLDVLSLSATPIPRTMHMAVAGIRDMSVIQTPPEDRQPIKTYVTADDDTLLAEVIARELARGGQVYHVHNRVRTIDRAAERVRRLVPGARVGIGHGQMAEDQLASVMVDFAAGMYDVLVCTTIIESGLDIPNVNTIIVERADRFGLAQLYQLRGRVGRGGKRAYAYLLYDPQRSLTEAADKRLDVLSGLHELGQGFRIALRDLEIRGAGNLLGAEQHGAIAAVGFEMYLQMLQAAIARLRSGGEPAATADVLSTPEISVDLPLDHFVPRSFIRDERLRLAAYRQLAAAEDERELDGVLRSLRDRYGPPPPQLGNLVYSLRVKVQGQRLGLRSLAAEGGDLVLRVDPDRYLDVDQLARRFAGRLAVRPNRLLLRRGEDWKEELIRLLEAMAELSHAPGVPSGV